MTYKLQWKINGELQEAQILKFAGDVYIEMEDMFGCLDFSMDMLSWAENGKIGDTIEDEDLRIEICA